MYLIKFPVQTSKLMFLEPEVSNEQTANEGFDASILHAPSDEHIVSNEVFNASILQAPIEGFSV